MSDDMRGLSKEERRARALKMLKAKPGHRGRTPPAHSEPAPAPSHQPHRTEPQAAAAEPALSSVARPTTAPEEQVTDRPAPAEAGRAARVARTAKALRRRPPERPQSQTPQPTKARGQSAAPDADVDEAAPVKAAPVKAAHPAPKPAKGPQSVSRTDALLQVSGMDVHYGKIQALRGINLTIAQGDVVALLGANGAGKSSTLRAISGMVTPSAGEIVFDGEVISGLSAFDVVKRGISHVPEGRELFPTLQVEENLRLGYWPQRKSEAGTLKHALDRVYTMFPRLGERRLQAAGTMSGGEQQMLAFGRALMSSPRLLLVDEMSLGLAPLIVRILFDAVDLIHSEGASVILVEQFVHQALRHAQRAYVLAKGEVSLEARADKLRNDPNLLAAYLGGAEGHVEEAEGEAVSNGAKRTKRAPKTTPAKKAGK